MKPFSLILSALLLVAVLGAALVPAGAQAPASGLVLLSAAGRRTLPTTAAGDREMVALDDLAAAFQLALRDDPLAGGMIVSYKGKSVAVMADQAIASVGGRLISLSTPVVRSGKRWLVPVDFIDRALALIYDARLDVRRTSRLVVVGDLRVPRLVVRQEVQAGGQTRITLDATPKTGNTIAQDGTRLMVRFDADALDLVLPAPSAQALVDGIRPGDAPNTIAILLNSRFGSFRASTAPTDTGGSRVTLDLLPFGAPATGAPPAPSPAPVPQAPAIGTPGTLPLPAPGAHTIAIDPGHGGSDEGARGPAGTLEKDLTLTVARKLKAAIENRLGLRVLLTRDADTLVSLDDRAAVANNNKADLFISLHANASLRTDVKGAQVSYLSADGYPLAEQAATAATSLPAFGGGSRDVGLVLWDMAQTRHLARSAAFADTVAEQLRDHVPMNVRPVQQAPFRVLVGANMPAVLVEMGFLTNAEQEQALRSNEFQNGIVQALFDAVVRFRDTSNASIPPAVPTAAAAAPGIR